jgi:hypothetical protein
LSLLPKYFLAPKYYLQSRHFLVKVEAECTELCPDNASQKLQINILEFQKWFKKWRMKANRYKTVHATFTTRRETCTPVHIKNVQLPKEKISSVWGYTLTGDLPCSNTFAQDEINWELPPTNYIGYSKLSTRN